ncbi:hypothetical protein C478_01985 [Natrinema thermotolerans DSM 11552]|uniref:DUF7351 domain-containing protein n=1 Tax=Natrinema sp. H-ect1 TaxID=3242700 RepID=UPI0002B12AF8|nr:hypothetical protein C478_01985 [Natrinema thermotolerans DSM 11552]
MNDPDELTDDVRHVERALSLLSSRPVRDTLYTLWEASGVQLTEDELISAVPHSTETVRDCLEDLENVYVYAPEQDMYKLLPSANLLFLRYLSLFSEENVTMNTRSVNGSCGRCDGELVGAYEDQVLTIKCNACDSLLYHLAFPPTEVAHRDPDGVFEAFEKRTRAQLWLVANGICRWCVGPTSFELVDAETDLEEDAELAHDVFVKHVCDRCGSYILTTVGEILLFHPAVIAFYHNNGIDILDRPLWEVDVCVDPEAVSVRSTGPWSLTVELSCGDATRRLELDESLEITATQDEERSVNH